MHGQVFIALEGVDGTGKTTVGKALAEALKATYLKTPLPQHAHVRHFFDRGNDMTARYLYYLATVVAASSEIREILKVGSVVCDRYLLSAICYHQILGVDTDMVAIPRLNLCQPDLYVCLIAEEETRAKRVADRDQSKVVYGALDDPAFLMRVQLELVRQVDSVVDTTYLAPSQIVHQILTITRERNEALSKTNSEEQ